MRLILALVIAGLVSLAYDASVAVSVARIAADRFDQIAAALDRVNRQ